MTADVIDIHTRRPVSGPSEMHFEMTVPQALVAVREALATALGGTRSNAVAAALAEADYWLEGIEGALYEDSPEDE